MATGNLLSEKERERDRYDRLDSRAMPGTITSNY
jgi:hypothetical protein